MARVLVHVPRMYGEEEFRRLVGVVPADFREREEEFWGYVEEKLKILSPRIRRVYLEGFSKGGVESLNPQTRCHTLVRRLVEGGAELHPTEDPMLVAETESWSEMLRSQPNPAFLELHRESVEERDAYIAKVIDQTLREGETGVIFIEAAHRLNLPEDVKIIKMCRFEPGDYLNTALQRLKLEKAQRAPQ